MFLILERPNDSVLSLEQWLLKSSGTFWLVSTCESFAFCFRTLLHVIQTFFLSSWEFVTTLDYEWRVIRGRLPYRWSIWVRNDWRLWFPWPLGRWSGGLICIEQVYSVVRVACLVGVVSTVALMNVTSPIPCQVSTVF